MIFMGVEWGEGWQEFDLHTGNGGFGFIKRDDLERGEVVGVFREVGDVCSIRVSRAHGGSESRFYIAQDMPPETALAKYVEYLLKGGDRAVVGN